MPVAPLNPKTAAFQVDSDADVGSGALTSLAAEGFPLSLGFASGSYAGAFDVGDTVVSKATGNEFLIAQGTGGPCAMLVASSGTGRFVLTLFVDAGAPSGGDGSVARPFNTIQAAINASVNGTAIVVTAGTYAENLVLPPQRNNLAIIGAGRGVTILQSAPATDEHTIQWVRTAADFGTPITTFEMRDLTIRCTAVTPTKHAIHFDASAEAVPPAFASFCTQFCSFEYVEIERGGAGVPASAEATYFNCVNYVFLRACRWYGTPAAVAAADSIAGTTVVVNCAKFELHDSSLLTNWDLTYNRALPATTGGRDQYLLSEASAVAPIQTNRPRNQGGTILRAHPILIVDPSSGLTGSQTAAGVAIPALQGTTLTAAPDAFGTYGPGAAPIIQCRGFIGGSGGQQGRVILQMPALTLAMVASGITQFVDFSRTQFVALAPAATTVISITAAAGGAVPLPVVMRECLFDILDSATGAPLANSITLGSAGTNALATDICGACYGSQAMFVFPVTAPVSTFDRTRWSVSGSITSAGVVVSVGPRYPTGASYNVSVETPVSAGVPVLTGVSAKLVNQFTATNTSVPGVTTNFELIRI